MAEEGVASYQDPLLAPEKQPPLQKNTHIFIAIVVNFLLIVGYYLTCTPSSSVGESPQTKTHSGRDPLKETCDLFTGEWIPNPKGPAYTNASCLAIEPDRNCMNNGRPDMEYMYWRWKPNDCDLPPFDAHRFANALRNKAFGFIGDSIIRNQINALACLLYKVEEPEVAYISKDCFSKGWYFPSYNITLAHLWAPYIVKENDYYYKGDNQPNEIYLDTLESIWIDRYHSFDYIVIAGGQWFYKPTIFYEHNQLLGGHDSPGFNEYGIVTPYRKALQLALSFITSSDHKPVVIFRTFAPNHFEQVEGVNGYICNRTMPYREGESEGMYTDYAMRAIEIEEFEKAAAVGAEKGLRMELMDIYHLSMLRPDGHPGPYNVFHPFAKNKNTQISLDCLHWCMPGPIDTWNEILMEMLVEKGYIS